MKTSFVWLFVVPLAFIAFMGMANKGPGDPGNLRPRVVVDQQDTNLLADAFVRELGTQGLQVLKPASAGQAEQIIRIPPDFTARVLAGKQAKVAFLKKTSSLSAESAMVELRLARALIRMNSHLLTAMSHGGTVSDREVRQAQTIAPTVRLDARFAGRKPVPVGFGFSLPGNMVMYLMMNLLVFGGTSLAIQRQNGIVRRLACHPLTRTQMIAGRIYGLILLGAAQIAVLLLAGRYLFGLRFGQNLWAILLTLLVYVWVAGSLGVLIGSLLRAEDKVIGVAVLSALLMAALGGCWWPLEIGPPVLRTIAHCFPTGWALDALHQLISFGGGLKEAGRPLAALGAFGLAANALAAWLFRW